MTVEIPAVIKPLLYEYEWKLKENFKDKIFGIYLYNSIAINAFDENKSDIDIVIIIKEDFTKDEVVELKNIHRELNKNFSYSKKMEGMYIKLKDISKTNDLLEPYIYFENGRLHKPGYYDINYVTWWTLKHNGIGINSPRVNDLNIKVDWEDILNTMNYNLNFYWKSKSNKKSIFILDYWIEFSVLTLCRIVNTLEYKEINSKLASANMALTSMNKEFNKIILEAIRIREGKGEKSLYRSRIKRSNDVQRFIDSTIDYCNTKYNLENL